MAPVPTPPCGLPGPSGPSVNSTIPDLTPVVGPRVCRNRHPPAQYREPDDGEEFNIHDHSDVLEEDIDLEVPGRHNPGPVANMVAGMGRTATQDPMANDRPPMDTLATNRSNLNSTITDPLATNASSTNKALDIDHFFQKETEQTVCKSCK